MKGDRGSIFFISLNLWFPIAVQMLVGLGAGLILQVPVSRRLVPFVLPVWVVVTIGVVIGLKEWAGCLGE